MYKCSRCSLITDKNTLVPDATTATLVHATPEECIYTLQKENFKVINKLQIAQRKSKGRLRSLRGLEAVNKSLRKLISGKGQYQWKLKRKLQDLSQHYEEDSTTRTLLQTLITEIYSD